VPVLSRELRLGFTLAGVTVLGTPETDAAVEGRLAAFGGCGKDAMLMVRRKDLSGLPGVRPLDADRIALRLEVELELERGERASDGFGLDGVRSLDSWYGEAARGVSGAGALFRALGLGMGGNEPVGGLEDGRDG
jgi:hypothetical protein